MLIDSHTHAYDEKDLPLIRERAAMLDDCLPDGDPNKWVLYNEGSMESLVKEEKEAGIDRFVLLPVSGRPERTSALNQWVARQADTYAVVIPFGSLIADSPTLVHDMEEVLELGLRGIKIHPFLQHLDILSPQADRLWSIIEETGLPVVLDSMYLVGILRHKPHLSTFVEAARSFETGPRRIAALAGNHPRLTLIAAHMGSLYGWDELEPLYPLNNIYFDLSFTSSILSVDRIMDIIRKKGSDHILFGTDTPWRNPREERIWFDQLPLTPAEREQIAWQNLENLLDHKKEGNSPANFDRITG